MADWVRTYLHRHQAENKAAILIASHNVVEVERMCGEAMIMKKGRIVDRGAPDTLIQR